MSFFIKRYILRISTHSLWLLLIIVGPVTYLVVSTLVDRISVSQDISLSEDSFVVVPASSPGKPKMKQLHEIISNPDSFFQDSIVLVELYNDLYPGVTSEQKQRQSFTLEGTIKECIYLTIPSNNVVKINYHGKDRRLGKALVGYYSSRLAQKAIEGRKNTSKHSGMTSKWTGNIELIGGVKIETHHTIWRSNRLKPLLCSLLISTLVILISFAIFEFLLDQSFKSEREAARYLELPILGSLPRLNDISNVIGSKSSG